jgi:hypothetical protein
MFPFLKKYINEVHIVPTLKMAPITPEVFPT